MDIDNPVIQLCLAGTRAEFEGKIEHALSLYMQAWEAARDDYDACIAAHYVARHQERPEDTLRWNQEALDRAAAVGDDRVQSFYPSLYLNMGQSYELLGNQAEANRYYALAAELGFVHQILQEPGEPPWMASSCQADRRRVDMEIIPNVHLIPGMRGANVYLLLGDMVTLVDTGMPGSAKAILAYIDSLDLAPADLTRIVITHYHLDHVGGLAAIKACTFGRGRTSAQVLAHPADAPFISGEQPPPPARSAMMRVLFRLLAPIMPGAEPVPVDGSLQNGDQLDLLSGATVVHVPGHTPGSIALHFPAERLLICGDVIDHRRNRLGPPPKPFTADMNQALASLRRLAELKFDVLCPGHGAPLVGGADEQLRAMVRGLA